MQLRYVIAGVLFILAVYGFFKALPLLTGPQIRIDPIVMTGDQGFITLSGQALHTETLTLDGSTLLIDENGRFSKMLSLPRGATILTFKATDRFGRSTSVTKEIVTP
ncbi:MAG TPA: hypothetical protein VGN56_01890 [Candidatus Paceibacterota bacterium]|jgi:hypothetical protein|nr:hypothetical protein [Candidatus Paceibacterota bacterium]